MNIEVHCPACKTTLSIPSELGGDLHACSHCGEKVLVPLAPGMKVGNFTLIRKIGEGGMGMVYLAEQKSMGRRVALKVLAPQFTRNPLFRDRFEKEIKLQAALSHPNIATAYDAGHDGPLYFLAMEYIEGRGLHTLVNKLGVLREKTALRITRQIATALSYAWKSSKMVHRDIKPSNILVDDDWNVKILDMGVSKSLKELADESRTAYVVGTPQYMAPEQMLTEDIDHRADIYSLGATLYHMVTGRPPYDENTLSATISKMEEGPAPHPKEFNSEISTGCAQLIRTMMACKPENRYAYWSSLVADISRVLSGQKPTMDTPPKNESYIALSPRLISKESPPRPKTAEVASRAATAKMASTPDGINLPALMIGVLALLILIMIYAMVSLLSEPTPRISSPPTLTQQRSTSLPAPPSTPSSEEDLTTESMAGSDAAETNITSQDNAVLQEDISLSQDNTPKKEETLLELENLYQFILERMEESPSDFQAHLKSIRQLRIDADLYGFSRYLILADELEQKNQSQIREEVDKLIERLTHEAEAAWDNHQYQKAQHILLNYSGPLARISAQRRKQQAEIFEKRYLEIKASEEIQGQLLLDALDRLTTLSAEHLIEQKPMDSLLIVLEEAIDSFGSTKQGTPFENIKDRLLLIKHLPEIILEGYKPFVNGDPINISTLRGTQFVRVRRIEPPYLTVAKTLEQGVIELPLQVSDLTIREKINRLSYLADADKQFIIGILALQSKNPQAAINYLSNANDPLSEALIKQLTPETPLEENGQDDDFEEQGDG